MPEIAAYWARIHAKDDEFKQALASSEGRFQGFVGTMTGLGAGIGAAFAAVSTGVRAIGGVAGILGGAIMKAGDLGESMSKTRVTFGESAGKIISTAEELSSKFGIVRAVSLEAAGSFGQVFKASGIGQEQAAGLSATMLKLAADMSSFHNIPIEDALLKLRSGLVGEAEPLRSVGVLLNETAVKAEAARMGLGGVGRELTDGEKVQARFNIIMRQTVDSQGDMERTADSSANMLRKLAGQWEELQTRAGEALLPGLTEILPELSTMAVSLGEFLSGHVDEIKELAVAFGKDLVSAIRSLAKELQGLYSDYKDFMAGGGGAALTVFGRVMKEGLWEVSRHPAGEEKSTDIAATDYHPELRAARKDRPPPSAFETETFKSEYESSKEWLAAQIRMRNEQAAADEGLAGSAIWGGLQSGLRGLWQGGQIANDLFRKVKPADEFKSAMIGTDTIASEVTKASLSRDDTTKKLAERQAKAGEKALEYLRPMAESIKDALIPKFA